MPRHSAAIVLARALGQLLTRAEELEARAQAGDEVAWTAYQDTLRTIAALQTTTERGGALLTTEQMAERLHINPKSLLRKVKRGELKPTVRRGRFVRWRGTEATG